MTRLDAAPLAVVCTFFPVTLFPDAERALDPLQHRALPTTAALAKLTVLFARRELLTTFAFCHVAYTTAIYGRDASPRSEYP